MGTIRRGVGTKERENEGVYSGCVCIMYENRRIKPVEIVLRRG
jgi:hypothetical protein